MKIRRILTLSLAAVMLSVRVPSISKIHCLQCMRMPPFEILTSIPCFFAGRKASIYKKRKKFLWKYAII